MLGRLMNALKWPTTLLLVALALQAALGLPDLVRDVARISSVWCLVAFGMAAYVCLWFFVRRTDTFQLLLTLEHELAHLLAAMLTFSPVRAMLATSDAGGHVITARTTWLVYAAPYVLPLPLLVPVALLLVASKPAPWMWVLLGCVSALHIHSSYCETHRGQTDLKELGFACSTLLLPACHAITAVWLGGVMIGHQRHLIATTKSLEVSLIRVAKPLLAQARLMAGQSIKQRKTTTSN